MFLVSIKPLKIGKVAYQNSTQLGEVGNRDHSYSNNMQNNIKNYNLKNNLTFKKFQKLLSFSN